MLSKTKTKEGDTKGDNQCPHVEFLPLTSAPDGVALKKEPEPGKEEDEVTLLRKGSEKIVTLPNGDGGDDEKPALRPAATADSNGKTGTWEVPARYIFTVLGFWTFFIIYCLRTCLSVALVAMVNSTALAVAAAADGSNNNDNINISDNSTSSNNTTTTTSYSYSPHAGKACPGIVTEADDVTADFLEGEFAWDEQTQGLVLGAFYYGYIGPQLLGGWLADRFKGKRLLGGSLLGSSLLSFLMPSAARWGPSFLTALRVAQGVAESTAFPGMHALCAEWIPVQERSRLVSFAYSGSELGTVGGLMLTGLLSRYGFAGGWPSAFYVFGMMGCVWFVLLLLLVFDSPAQHPRISERERHYIQESIGTKHKVKPRTPWRTLLTSGATWAICVAHTAYNWGYYSMFSYMPTFLKQILHFTIVANGFLTALPYLLMWLTQVLAGIVSDQLRRYVSVGFVRKLMFTLGSIIPACFLVATGYVDCDQTLATVLLTIGVAGKGMAGSAVMVNHLDFAPRFAGTLYGLSNTFASIPGFVGPALVGYLTYSQQTIEQWRKFFYITGAIYVVSILLFMCLAKGQVQPWAAPPPSCVLVPDPPHLNERHVGTGKEKPNHHLEDPEDGRISVEKERLNPQQ